MKRVIKRFVTDIERNETQEGRTLEQEIEVMLTNGEEIGDATAQPQFTERKMGVIDAFNIRHDKWNTAQRAMQKVHASYEAKRFDRIQERENPEPLPDKGVIED